MDAAGDRGLKGVDAALGAGFAASRSSSWGLLVLISIQVPPGAKPWMRPSGPATTSPDTWMEGRQVMTESDAAAVSAGVEAHTAPACEEGFRDVATDVVHDDLVPGGEQVGSEVIADVAQTHTPDPHLSPSWSSTHDRIRD